MSMNKFPRFSTVFAAGCIVMLLVLAGCAKEKKKEEMSFDELKGKAFTYLEKKKNDEAIAYFEEILTRFPDNPNIARYKMNLAELYFTTHRYPSAHQMYDHFNQFYPADDKAEYAKYKSILSMFQQSNKTDCDQTETEGAIRLCIEYLSNPNYMTYRKEVNNMQLACQEKLIDKEVYVFNFYLRQGSYDAARSRLKSLRDRFASIDAGLEPRLLFLECKLARKENNRKQIQETIDKLVSVHPESQYTQMAQGLATRRSFIF